MLKSIKNDKALIQELISGLSPIRLSNYKKFFKTVSDEEVLGLYQWNEELSSVFFRTISIIEVLLRNQFHRALSVRYGALEDRESRNWYEFLNLNDLSKAKIQAITHERTNKQLKPRSPLPSPDDVVSRVTFGFWPHLIDVSTDVNGQVVDWGCILPEILPGHRQKQATYWRKQKHQDVLFTRLQMCNYLRNRIAHHEPIWKLGPLKEEKRPRAGVTIKNVESAPRTTSEALARLRLLHERLLELLSWLSPNVATYYRGSELCLCCQYLLQETTLLAYKNGWYSHELDLAMVGSFRKLRKALRYSARHKQPIRIIDGEFLLGYLKIKPF